MTKLLRCVFKFVVGKQSIQLFFGCFLFSPSTVTAKKKRQHCNNDQNCTRDANENRKHCVGHGHVSGIAGIVITPFSRNGINPIHMMRNICYIDCMTLKDKGKKKKRKEKKRKN